MQCAQRFDVVDQALRRDRAQVDVRLARQWTAAPAATLVKERHAVAVRVEVGAPPRLGSRSWAAVQHNGGLTKRVADPFPEDQVTATCLQDSGVEGLHDRIVHRVIMALN